ncbi:hypothetical protein [Demequina sp. NBRC 110057]|uniref:hypothetical protein n=1 Tax=Demequina sp. NBRC 110057 TaxID=1570346 RepID=UPI001177CF01|nr:hypothetical protein [Demequina sp. NBRC 110057]
MRLRTGVPVLARSDGALQVGLSRPLVLRGLGDEAREFVGRLEHGREPTPAERAAHAPLWRALEAHGALDGDAAPAPVRVRVRDTGPLGVAIVAGVIAAGGRAGFAAREAGDLPGPARTAALRRLHVLSPRAVPLMAHAEADIDVVVGVGASPPLALALVARDLPHLVVTTDDEGVTVGPLVRPGEGACGTCADLTRVDADPEFPWLAAQCAARPTGAPAAPLALVAALAAHLCAAADAAAGTAWRVPRSGLATRADVAPHPACDCGAAGAVGDEVTARRTRLG